MAKFFYRMQNILNIKYKLETQAKTAYANASNKLHEEEEKLNILLERKECYKDKIREINGGVLNIRELRYYMESVEIIKHQIEEQMKEVNNARRALELARIKLNDVMVDRKTHEKLKEKAFDNFKTELEISEKKEVDELNSFKYNKNN